MKAKIKVLVLSGANFVSQGICEALQASDWATPIYAGVSDERLPNPDIETCIFREDQPLTLIHLLERVDAVVNCTGSPGGRMLMVAQTISDYVQIRRIKVVCLGSISAYGHVEGDVSEFSPLVFGIDDYSNGKAKTDEMTSALQGSVVFREGIVYGPGSEYWGGVIGRLLISKRLGNLGTNGEGLCNLIYIDDVVQAVLKGLKSSNTEANVFNLVAPYTLTWNDFLFKYSQAIGCNQVTNISNRKLIIETKIYSVILIAISKLLSKLNIPIQMLPPPLRTSLLASFRQKIRIDSRKISAEYSMEWKPLEDGLAEMALWLKTQMK